LVDNSPNIERIGEFGFGLPNVMLIGLYSQYQQRPREMHDRVKPISQGNSIANVNLDRRVPMHHVAMTE
jgi:hypothetical protein